MLHQDSSRVIKLLTIFLDQFQKMGVLESYQLSSTPQFVISKGQINSLLEQIKCLKIVLLEIKTLESLVDKKGKLGAQDFLYDSIDNEQNKTIEKQSDDKVCKAVKSQISISKTPKCTSQIDLNINLVPLEQLDHKISKLNITTDNVNGDESNTYTVSKVMNENTVSCSTDKNIINSITVNVDECKESKNEKNKQNFNYSESLKTPNPDFGDKKLSDTTGYIEVEPPTPLLYENISKDLAEPDCDGVKTVSFIKEMVRDNDNCKEATQTVFMNKMTGGDEILNQEKEPVNFLPEMNSRKSKSNEDISTSEDFIRAMISGESTSENPNEEVLTKADDFIQKMLTSDSNIKNKVEQSDYLRALISKDAGVTAKRQEPSNLVQDLMSEKKELHDNTPRAEDFIKEIINGASKDANYKDTEKEINKYNENKIDEVHSIDPCLDYHIDNRKQENGTTTQQQKNASDIATEVVNHERAKKDASLTQISNKTIKANESEKDDVEKVASISFLSEIPNVTNPTNNFMSQIIDNKPKTPSHLNFMDDLNSKQSCEKADDLKYDSESLKTPKPVIAEDSNYYTEEHDYSFTVLDTQYKPQSSCSLFEDNKKYGDDHTANFYDVNRRSSYNEDTAKPKQKSNTFGVDSTQEHTGFNYNDSTTGNLGNRTRPSVPIHIEQNKIYERETEKDMNTFTIPSLSFFNCDTLYDDDSVLNKKPYTMSGEYNAPVDYGETQRNEENNQQGYFHNETYEQYEQSETYKQRENYDQNKNHGQNVIYEQNSNSVFYNKSGETTDCYNTSYSKSYDGLETYQYSGYAYHQYHEDTFSSYQQDYQNYFSEDATQNYPACSYEQNVQHPVFSTQTDFVSAGGYNMNFTNDPHPVGERGNESSQVLQDATTFPSYGQSDYTHMYNTQNTHQIYYGCENYNTHTCAMAQHEPMYQSSINHGVKDVYDHYDTTPGLHNVNHRAFGNEPFVHSAENANQHNYQAHNQMSKEQSQINSGGYLSQACQSDQHRHDEEVTASLNLMQTGYQDKDKEVNTNSNLTNQTYSTSAERLLDYNHLMCEETLEKLHKPMEASGCQNQLHPNGTLSKFSSSDRNENKENFSHSRGLRNHIEATQADLQETAELVKNETMESSTCERHVLEEQGESQSETQDLKFFETLKKFTEPPPAFDVLSGSQQNSLKHTMSCLSKHSAKKRFSADLSSSLVSDLEGENSTDQSALTYTQLRTPERENIQYSGDLKTLLACSYYTEELPGLQHLQKSKKPKSQLEISRDQGHRAAQNEQDEKGFCCEFCGQMFMTKHSLKYHHTTLHRLNTDQAFVCHICTKPYHRKSVLVAHLQSHEGVKKFTCEYCPARFSQKISCRVHMLGHRGDFKYECAVCAKKYPTQAKLNFHVKSHEEAYLTCVHCNKKFTTKQYLRQHLNIHQKMSGGVTCEDCGAEFKSHKARLSHKQRSHPIALHDCYHCSHSFTSSALLSKHVSRLHSASRQSYSCSQCPKVFLSKPILLQHVQSNHNPDSSGKVKPYQCGICTKKYSFQSKLSAHMKTHAQTPSIACPICGKPFYRKDVMRKHQATHLARNVS